MNGMHMCFSFSSRASFLRTSTVLAKVILNLNHARHQQIPAVKLLPTDRRVGACDFIGLGQVSGHFVPWSDRSKSDRSNQLSDRSTK